MTNNEKGKCDHCWKCEECGSGQPKYPPICDWCDLTITDYVKQVEQDKAQLEEKLRFAVEALEHYADSGNWNNGRYLYWEDRQNDTAQRALKILEGKK
jgi:hypothetical protein